MNEVSAYTLSNKQKVKNTDIYSLLPHKYTHTHKTRNGQIKERKKRLPNRYPKKNNIKPQTRRPPSILNCKDTSKFHPVHPSQIMNTNFPSIKHKNERKTKNT